MTLFPPSWPSGDPLADQIQKVTLHSSSSFSVYTANIVQFECSLFPLQLLCFYSDDMLPDAAGCLSRSRHPIGHGYGRLALLSRPYARFRDALGCLNHSINLETKLSRILALT